MTFEPFDILGAPLSGANLIEASAGTGKTFTIAGLYLRLIVEKRLTVDQILVVTFTKAATEELKQRIRARLLEARKAFMGSTPEDELLDRLVKQSRHPQMALARITDAIRDFDACAIFTIHGFCQRILHENAFETGSLFDTELITEQKDILVPICQDYWRHTLYEAPPEFIRYALLKLKGPYAFLALLTKSKDPDLLVIPQQERPSLDTLAAFRSGCRSIEKEWLMSRDRVEALLMDPVLNGTAYGSLKADKQQPDLTVREQRVKKLTAAMDIFCTNAALRFPLFKDFEKFSTSYVAEKTKKGKITPQHPFLDRCEELCTLEQDLLQEMQALLLFVKTDLFRFAREKLPFLKERKNIQYFDDLLTRVRDALFTPGADVLSSAVQRRFKAAMVDEFQDTDMLQYTIFSRLFADKGSLFFMIGDPKQAIYGFRGADIFSYMHASIQAQKQYTLLTNYRSHAKLITAVNTIFSKVHKPFIFDEIPFVKGMPAETTSQQNSTTESLLDIWFAGSAAGAPMNKGDAEKFISAAVAADIRDRIDAHESVNPGDIAVLVRTNIQAEMVKKDLSQHQVPAVFYSAGNVFETREARDLFLLMASIVDPFNPGRFHAALATSLMGVTLDTLDLQDAGEEKLDHLRERFVDYHQTWADHGFVRMINRLMAQEHVRSRMLAREEGERRLTNILHLAELLHDSAVRNSLGMPALLKWFSIQRDPESGTPETYQLRLESDALTVKIITIHKSKGLEFPVVFCPFAWGSSSITGEGVTFHDQDNDQRLTLDLGSRNIENHRAWAQYELLAENLRLLYVALTRAREQCVLAWGHINKVETSALAYLLHYTPENESASPPEDLLPEIQFQYNSKNGQALLRDLKALEASSDNSIRVTVLKQPVPAVPEITSEMALDAAAGGKDTLCLRKVDKPVEDGWHIYSYSSLTSSKKYMPLQASGSLTSGHPLRDAYADPDSEESEQPDRDVSIHVDEDPIGPAEKDERVGERTIFTFAKGARAGIFFHDLFEHLDFTKVGEIEFKAYVVDTIKAYSIDPVWQDIVLQTIENVLGVSLQSDQDKFTLSMVAPHQRVNEMEFYFPLKKISSGMLCSAFHTQSGTSRFPEMQEHMGRLQFAPAKGFMKGFIDLIFSFNNRYYLLDWKSNHLGDAIEDYAGGNLDRAMQHSYYTLQYHIYTLALHLFLQSRLPGYQYEKHFGGVFYLFIRGIDMEKGANYGVFYDRPAKDLVVSLEDAMVPER